MVVGRMISGVILGLFLILGGMLIEGGHLSSVMTATAFSLVIGGAVGFQIASFPLAVHRAAWRLALGRDPGEVTALRLSRQYFQSLGNALPLFGVIGTVLGLIHVMENLDRPDRIGPGIAVAFTAALYGYGARLLFAQPLTEAVSEKLARADLAPVAVQAKAEELTLRHETKQDRAA